MKLEDILLDIKKDILKENDCGCGNMPCTCQNNNSHEGDEDYEGEMAKNQLSTIIRMAQEIQNKISDDTELEAWVQSKITNAEDYISTIANYINSEHSVSEAKIKVPTKNDGDSLSTLLSKNPQAVSFSQRVDTDPELTTFIQKQLPQLKIFQLAIRNKAIPRYAELVRKAILSLDPNFKG
jgi:hypothetical protein